MSARRSPHTCVTDDRTPPAVVCSCESKPPFAALWARGDWIAPATRSRACGRQGPHHRGASVSPRLGDPDAAAWRVADRNRRGVAASQSRDHDDLHQGGSRRVTDACVAVAGRCVMTTLRSAVQEYLILRRSLGFKSHDAGKGLLAFVTFMEQQRGSYITTQLALTWAQQPTAVQPAEWARRPSVVRAFARYRRATDPRTEIPPEGLLPYRPSEHDPTCTRPRRSGGSTARSRCPPAEDYAPGLTIAVRVTQRRGRAPQRSAQPRAAGRRSPSSSADDPSRQVRQSRLVPLHASARHVLADYLARRARRWARRPVSSYVFVSNRGHGWIADESTARSMHCPGRLAYAVLPRVMGRVCTICDIASPSRRCGAGPAPATMPSDASPSWPPTSVMSA